QDTVVVTNEQGATVAALDVSTGAIRWETQLPGGPSSLGGPLPGSVAVTPDGRTLLVTAQGTNQLLTIDASSGAIDSVQGVRDHADNVLRSHWLVSHRGRGPVGRLVRRRRGQGLRRGAGHFVHAEDGIRHARAAQRRAATDDGVPPEPHQTGSNRGQLRAPGQ